MEGVSMKKFGLLAIVLCLMTFTLGCPEQPKATVTPKATPPAVQPAGDEKAGETAAPAGEKKPDEAMPAGEKKADDAKPAEEKKAE
jgi:hypothetical protein